MSRLRLSIDKIEIQFLVDDLFVLVVYLRTSCQTHRIVKCQFVCDVTSHGHVQIESNDRFKMSAPVLRELK